MLKKLFLYAIFSFHIFLITASNTILLSDYSPEIYIVLKEELEKAGYIVLSLEETLKQDAKAFLHFDIVITMNINPIIANTIEHHNKNTLKKTHLYAIMLEPPHFDSLPYNILFYAMHNLIFTLDDSLAKLSFMNKYIKISYPQPSLSAVINPIPFNERKLLTLINSYKQSFPEAPTYYYDLYQERFNVIDYFNNQDCFDFYGRQWEDSRFASYSSYKGKTDNKIATLQKYRFAICFENSCHTPGYITEKIFDAFIAGIVPVYWGAPNVTNYIPSDCFIDMRDFKNYHDLHTFLISIDETTYNSYIKAEIEFLQSAEAQKFLNSNVAKEITKEILRNFPSV